MYILPIENENQKAYNDNHQEGAPQESEQATGREGKKMTKREKERISKTIEGLKAQSDHMDSERDRENLLNRADALELVLSIAE